jgi:hypothetical protein
MQEKMENKGVLEFAPLFPNKPNADGCLPNLRKQEMMQQAYEMKDKKFDGQSLQKQGANNRSKVIEDRRNWKPSTRFKLNSQSPPITSLWFEAVASIACG